MSEHDHQKALFRWAEIKTKEYPCLALMFAVPNGGLRNPGVAKKLKAEGVKAGVPDVCLPVARAGYFGMWIELKIKPNKPTASQIHWLNNLKWQGYYTCLCSGWQEAATKIEVYLRCPETVQQVGKVGGG